jgi:AcrR family transcriptional regulator
MAYRKTDEVRATLAERRQEIITAALDIMADGEEPQFHVVAARAGYANGTMYKYFPDKAELMNAAAGFVLAADLTAMREAASRERFPLNAFAAALAVFYRRLKRPRLVRALAAMPAYRNAVRRELAGLIGKGADVDPVQAKLLAAASLGALYGVWEALGVKHEEGPASAVQFALLGLGIPARGAVGISDKVKEGT